MADVLSPTHGIHPGLRNPVKNNTSTPIIIFGEFSQLLLDTLFKPEHKRIHNLTLERSPI